MQRNLLPYIKADAFIPALHACKSIQTESPPPPCIKARVAADKVWKGLAQPADFHQIAFYSRTELTVMRIYKNKKKNLWTKELHI